jgi:hypothetical protein
MHLRISNIFAGLAIVLLLAACSKQSAQKQEPAGESQLTEEKSDTATTIPSSKETVAEEKPVVEEPKKKEETVTKPVVKEEPKIPEPVVVSLPESTVIAIELIDSIDTDVHVTGTEYRARLLEPVVFGGETVFEKGATAVGVLNKVVESGRMKTPAELVFSLVSIEDRSGQQVQIDTYPLEEKKDSHTKKQVGLIGGGALVGGIIGKVTGKKGGTEIGAVAGAAAGAAAAAATGKQDITLHSGTQVHFVLRSPVRVTIPKEGPISSNQ